ncbi:TonB-dependent receptor [Arcicella aquatica]|uniref:TonB-dependent receptor n=1 Tax=Arcicella aquatica TaxID=217141 RepID=A0ABU5QMK2_9BACT|nr:TonB-dependent receptor [Arcicella aquatica]MEA5258287.1 TonB-dependent receptor [Arcicella aquatica]
MMKTFTYLLILYFLFIATQVFSQTTVTGKVLDEKGKGLPGANISLKGSYDGATADADGNFRFTSTEKGEQILVCTFVGFDTFNKSILMDQKNIEVIFKLKESANELNTVTVTAGTFEASDEKKTTLIKPLDIVTTAGGGADITKTMTLLTPGSQRNGESTGMFVRGGSAQESKILIDGLTVQNAYNTASPDVASRSRFSPFQFKGSAFSTGGYSAQYGQALSAVLLMNTTDLATESSYTVNANFAQLATAYTNLSDNHSISGTLAYTNLTPLFKIYPQNIDWVKIPEQINAAASYRLKPSADAAFKLDAVYAKSESGMMFNNTDQNLSLARFGIKNDNILITSTYQKALDKNAAWVLKSGASYSYNKDILSVNADAFEKTEQRSQFRAVAIKSFDNGSNILFGTEGHIAEYGLTIAQALSDAKQYKLTDNFETLFSESEFYLTRKLAGRIGVRAEYSSLASSFNVAPRFSLAYKTGLYSQISAAGGSFYQTPDFQYYYYNKTLGYEKATHAVLNYQVIKDNRTFRVEAYYKKYSNLVREYPAQENYFDANPQRFPNGRTDNSGFGDAQGLDVFFRDNKSFKNGQLWVNYSYCDSKRLAGNYLTETQPSFVSNHNLNVIYKQYIAKPMMTVSGTYSFTSGRPYYNPNNPVFMSDRTPVVHNTSIWVNYLTNIKGNFMVVYFSVDNILGTHNVYNYRYSDDGKTRTEVRPAAYRMIMLGTFITISKKKVLPEDMRKN